MVLLPLSHLKQPRPQPAASHPGIPILTITANATTFYFSLYLKWINVSLSSLLLLFSFSIILIIYYFSPTSVFIYLSIYFPLFYFLVLSSLKSLYPTFPQNKFIFRFLISLFLQWFFTKIKVPKHTHSTLLSTLSTFPVRYPSLYIQLFIFLYISLAHYNMDRGEGLMKYVDKAEVLVCRLYNDSINCKWVNINIIHSSVCYRLILPLKIGNHKIYDTITLNYYFLLY